MPELRFAWEQVKPQLSQLAMAIVVVALGVGLSSAMLLANRALRERYEESVEALAGIADVQVTAKSGGTFDLQVLESVREVDGVKAAAPLLVGTAFTSGDDHVRLRLIGVDMLDDDSVRVYRRGSEPGQIDDPLEFMNQPRSVIVPQPLLRELGAARGDTLSIETALGRHDLTIRGVLDDSGVARAAGGHLLVMDLFAAQSLLGVEDRVTQIDVVAGEAHSLDDVQARLRAVLPGHLDVERVADRKADLARMAAAYQTMLSVIATMGLVLAALITSNRLSTIYQARVWEMGVMRALGTRPAVLVRMLLGEAALVAAVGALLGIPLGVAMAQVIVQPVADTMTLNLQQIVSATWVRPRLLPILLAATAGVASGVLAALVPAVRVARLSVIHVLTVGRSRDPWPESIAKRRIRRAFTALAATLLALQLAFDVGAVAGATMLAVALAGGLLVEPALRMIARPLSRVLAGAAWIGIEDQSKVPSRAVGAGVVLMAGIALVIWINSMAESFEHYVVDRIMLDRTADLVVDSGFNDVVVGDDARLADTILDEIRRVPGVGAVGAGVNTVSLEPETGIVAVDPIRFRRSEFGRWPLDDGASADALDRVSRGEAVLTDANLAARRGLSIGSMVRLMTPSGVLERPLAGITPTKFRSPSGDVMLSRDLYKSYWHDDTISQAFVVLDPGASLDETRRAIESKLGGSRRLRILSKDELADWYASGVRGAYSFLDVLAVLTLVVVVIGTSDALAANILERTREIGTMRALGLSSLDVGIQVVAQAMAIAAVGTSLALATGYGMSFAFVKGLIPSLLGWQLGLEPTYGLAVIAIVLGALACVVGAVVPALRAARMSPVVALRYE